jgi:DNA gyrase subunit A
MDEAELRLALERLEADLRSVEAKLAEPGYGERTPQRRLDEERQWRNELLARVEAQREQIAGLVTSVGPAADRVGRWAPLALFDRPSREDTPGELPPAPLDVTETELADPDAIAREVSEVLQDQRPLSHLAALGRRWKNDPAIQRLVAAALRTGGFANTALKFGPNERTVLPRSTALPPTPWLSMATEVPDEFDGLTASQRRVLQAMRVAAPPGRPFLRLSEIATEVAARDPESDLPAVERTLISLGHPSLRRLPLIEMQGFTGRFTPPDTHLTHARLSREGLEVLEETLALPLLLINGAEGANAWYPPHAPGEILNACLYVIENPKASIDDLTVTLLKAPDFPDGGVVLQGGVRLLWGKGSSNLSARARVDLEVNQQSGQARICLTQFPWPLRASEVQRDCLAMQAAGDLDGVTAIVDESSATGGRLVLVLEHLAFSSQVRKAILESCVAVRSCDVEFLVRGAPYQRRVDLVDLLRAFIEHRREVAVKKLDRAVAQARLRAQGAEAVCVALALLEPVQAVMRASVEDEEAILGLMQLMKPEHRSALAALPFPASHPYATGFTEYQARHLLSVRKLASRSRDSATRDWAELMRKCDEARSLLNDRQAILDVVRQELREALARFGGPRRTQLVDAPREWSTR